jgi:hypothetical protein
MNTTIIISTSFLFGFIAGAVCFAKYGLSIAGQVKAEVASVKAHISQEISGVITQVSSEESALKAKTESILNDLKK